MIGVASSAIAGADADSAAPVDKASVIPCPVINICAGKTVYAVIDADGIKSKTLIGSVEVMNGQFVSEVFADWPPTALKEAASHQASKCLAAWPR